jgi:CheY-like chemotaxis protein
VTTHEVGKLLVVDDDGVSRAVLQNLLEMQGHSVEVARDGTEGLARARQEKFDLILLDLLMPGMDGHEVVETLKADPDLRGVSVVMISSVEDMKEVVKCVKLGADDYIFKPFDEVLLKTRVDSCLERRRLRERAMEK